MRVLYHIEPKTGVTWPEPLESSWQWMGGEKGHELAPKLPHLSLAEILMMAMVMSLPREHRPWGIVTWMAMMFGLSRPALYSLSERVRERLLPEAEVMVQGQSEASGQAIEVTTNRIARTVLTASVPGKSAIRPVRQVLGEAFDQSRSIGWISQLLSEAGEQAGELLKEIDTSPLGTVIAVRDETFFQDWPLLLVVEPVSRTILFGQVCADRQADTWGAALLLAQEQGVKIGGLVEDMARMYPKSQREAQLEVPVQKDVWHILRDGGRIALKLEKTAFAATRHVLALEKKLLKAWDETLFMAHYIPAVAHEEQSYQHHHDFTQALAHLDDALQLVDWRSGEIRERASNAWLLDETLTLLSLIDHPKVQRWLNTLRRHQSQLLTYLTWLETALQDFRPDLADALPPDHQQTFLRTVARHWRLQQALTNGHRSFASLAAQAQAAFNSLVADDPLLFSLAQALLSILDAACRASSIIENINGLLKQFLHHHQAFRSPDTLQLYLNLFILWHNTRTFERGKHQGFSPYQVAGIDPGSDDWLALLGFPPL